VCSSDLQAIALSGGPEDALAKDPAAVTAVLGEVRRVGYALRDPSVWPASNTLAVPVFDNHGVACSFGLTYFSSTMKPQQAIDRYLPELQRVAQAIGDRLKALQAPAPRPPAARRRKAGTRVPA
jgi:IclR family mhp operon transcriptional activator